MADVGPMKRNSNETTVENDGISHELDGRFGWIIVFAAFFINAIGAMTLRLSNKNSLVFNKSFYWHSRWNTKFHGNDRR